MRTPAIWLILLLLIMASCDGSSSGEPKALPASSVGTPTPIAPPVVAPTAGVPPVDVATPAPTPTRQPTTATVTVLNLHVRGGPGTDYVVLGQVHTGDTFVVTGKTPSGSWLQIVYDDAPGWIYAEFVTTSGTLDVVPATGREPTSTPIAPPTARPSASPIAPPIVEPTATPFAPPEEPPTPIAPPEVTPIAPPPVTPSPSPTPTAAPPAP